jgi:hypothetical protein
MSFEIIHGDDVSLAIALTKNGAPFTIDPAATVTAVLRSGVAQISPIVTCDEGATGADWSTGLVVVEMTPAESIAIVANTFPSQVTLEIQVDDTTKESWLIDGVLNYGSLT